MVTYFNQPQCLLTEKRKYDAQSLVTNPVPYSFVTSWKFIIKPKFHDFVHNNKILMLSLSGTLSMTTLYIVK